MTGRLVVALALLAPAHAAHATGAEPGKSLQADPARCLAAAAANDDDRIMSLCSALLDNDKTAKPDRIKALIARAGVSERRASYDAAITDYGEVLWLDPTLADIFNARGELWRRKGDRRNAVADFAAALKLKPDQPAAKANHRLLAQELEKVGVLIAVAGKPSFDCAAARRPVEKAICASPLLADLDRQIHGSYIRVTQEAPNARLARDLRRTQEEFIARRNAQFGKPGYDLQKAMHERLQQLNGVDGY